VSPVVQTLPCPRGGISGLTFSPDGDMLAGVGGNGLHCWTRSRGWEQTGLREPDVDCVAFHPDGRALAYFGQHLRGAAVVSQVRLYSLTPACRIEPNVLTVTPDGDPPAVPRLRRVAFTPDGLMLVINRTESRGMFYSPVAVVEHWNLAPDADGWRVTDTAPARTMAPNGALHISDFTLVLVGAWGTQVCPLDASATAQLRVPDVSRARFVATSPRGELVAVGEQHRVRVWHLRTVAPVAVWRIAGPESLFVPARAFSPDGRRLAIGTADGLVTSFDPLSGRAGTAFDFGVGAVHSLAYAPDGLTLAVAGHGGLVVVDVE
jgi:WD40 repeat protein